MTTATAIQRRLAARLPAGTWCSHMHVVDPHRFPLARDARYVPAAAHTLADARAFFAPLGISRMVVVQPSIYGTDNACTLSALPELGPESGRAVVQFDPDNVHADQLHDWHRAGVRGVRLNYKSVGAKPTPEGLAARLLKYAAAVKPLGWVIELYIALEDVPLLVPVIPKLDGAKVCIDHLGHPSVQSMKAALTASELAGWESFTELLERDNVWCKLSATYRLSRNPRDPLVESMCKGILDVTRGERCVFATDWPHTQFENLDVLPFLEAVLDWIEASG
ncbi:hypothetical protein HK405_007906, partial [Cladochytrium tenue]